MESLFVSFFPKEQTKTTQTETQPNQKAPVLQIQGFEVSGVLMEC